MPSLDSVITLGWTAAIRAHHREFIIPAITEILSRFGPIYFLWGPGRDGTNGHHSQGRAVDISILAKGAGPVSTWVDRPGPARPSVGNQVAAYALKNRTRLNIDRDGGYIIWNRRITSAASSPPWSWRPYTGTNPHTDHVHISFAATGVYHAPEPTEDEDMATYGPQILAAIKTLGDVITASNEQSQRRYESLLKKSDLVEGREVRRDAAEDAADDAVDRELAARIQLALDKLASIEDKIDGLPDPVPPTGNPPA